QPSFYCYAFFFFQAEDGIRDFHVTGVQTCALPISKAISPITTPPPIMAKSSKKDATTPSMGTSWKRTRINSTKAEATAMVKARRSEERRVGKECRCRWAT